MLPLPTRALFSSTGRYLLIGLLGLGLLHGAGIGAPQTLQDDRAAYDPLETARVSIGQSANPEAGVPPQCYTHTAGETNPCWTCHTAPTAPNALEDWKLQEDYAFSETALTNHWQNLFVERSAAMAALSDEAVWAYIRQDNYTPLRQALAARPEYPGWVPDLDFQQGFDADGFAHDGSGWRAVRYKPFLGTFWPTNGSTDDVMLRLPQAFRSDSQGRPSRAVYQVNLAIVEAAIAVAPAHLPDALGLRVEPLDETLAGVDLDGDGQLTAAVTRLQRLPSYYVGGAQAIPVVRYLYPRGTEFLHTVRYLDPDQPTWLSSRMKEVRYARKVQWLDPSAVYRAYAYERQAKARGLLPTYTGSPLTGLRNSFGWQFQGFIEDAAGRLRVQTEEEHRFCMGCHSSLGVTVDQTFALARKIPGAAGWRPQDVRDIPDVPQHGHLEPELLTYLRRVLGGDEFRANTEMQQRFFPAGVLDAALVRRAAPGGDQDLAWAILPSRPRALALNRAYMALVPTQTFALGRDTLLAPPVHVHRVIRNGATELRATGRVFQDGRLWLDWDAGPASGVDQEPAR